RASGQSTSDTRDRPDHLWLLEQLLQGQRGQSFALGEGTKEGARVTTLAASTTGTGAGPCHGHLPKGGDRSRTDRDHRSDKTAGESTSVPPDRSGIGPVAL